MANTNHELPQSQAAVAERVESPKQEPAATPTPAPTVATATKAAPPPPAATGPGPRRKWLLIGGGVLGLALAGYFLVPWVDTALNTVSTDDAYVNGHVTMVAPRVAGQVSKVLVDDNMRVKKGDILVQLDREPYQVQVEIKKAAVKAAEKDLVAAKAMAGSQVATLRSQRWKLQYTMEQVTTQVANLKANVATLESRKADLVLANENFKRSEELIKKNAIAKEEYDQRFASLKSAEAAVEKALQDVYATRVGLGLPAQPEKGHSLTEVLPDLEQNSSKVKTALAETLQTAAQLGLPQVAEDITPEQALDTFQKLHPKGDIDAIFKKLVGEAPAVKQAEAKLLQSQTDLAQTELNLRYCDVVSEIDGVVTSRNVNPGNNVQPGQSLMAVRSLTEIWIDANFKETQLADLKIGQHVKIEVDMYGGRKEFKGRITGFTMGTGQMLALLPPQNATGNFVKIVQRLPVKIELIDYDPAKAPLFVGLSVTPYVYFKEPPTGPHAGEILQPLATPATK